MLVPAHVEDRHTERSLAAVLCVDLFDVAEPGDQLLTGNGFAVLQKIPLPNETQLVRQDICVGGDSCHGAHHILVQLVNLLREEYLVEEFVCVSPLSCEKDTVVGQDTKARAGVTDGLHGILDLVEATLWREYRCTSVISSGLKYNKQFAL